MAQGTPAGGWTPREAIPSSLFPPWGEVGTEELVVAIAVVFAGVYLSKYFVRLVGRPISRRFARESVAQTVLRLVRLTIVVVSTFVAAGIVGFRIGDIVLSVTVFSAVLGIVLAPIVGSIINGLFVLADQPYEIGDMIELDDGTRGFIDDITLRYTKVFTLENTFIVIPNSVVRDQKVINYSAEDERTRLSLGMVVTYESDIPQARRLFEQAASSCEEVIEGGPDIRIGTARYPAKPTCYIDEYGDDGILLTLRYWAKKPYKLLTVRSNVQTALRERLADSDADVTIAYPHRHLVFDQTSGQARVAVDGDAAGNDPGARIESLQSAQIGGGRSSPDGEATASPDPGAATSDGEED